MALFPREPDRASPATILPASVLGPWLPLSCILLVSLALLAAGIKRDLPFTPEIDEPHFVEPAVNIAATGDLNPREFENPGSTVIYPLAGIYHVWNAVAHDGTLFRSDPGLRATVESNPSEFYLLGRLLTISYAVMTVPLIFLIGRRAFGERVGLIGSGLFVLYPLAVTHAQMVRTDSAATFFGMLGVWMCLRLYDRPTTGNQILAGFAIGLAIASRYFMVALIPVLLAVGGMILWRQISQADKLKATWVGIGAGVLAVAVGFAVTTPYFFLDFTAAWQEVTFQAGHSNHLGADGLSPPENFLWYLTRAIPLSITWPEAILAASGVALVVWRRRFKQILLVLFTVVFLVGISRAPLHWQRWIIQILPILALLVAYAIAEVAGWLARRLQAKMVLQLAILVLAGLAVAAWPGYKVMLQDIQQARPSTRILAREWIFANVPVGSRLAQEWYTAPSLGDAHLDVLAMPSLGGRGLGEYRREGFEYLVVSSWTYDRYLAEPQRYEGQALFYRSLFEEGDILQWFRPSNTRGGPEIRIYRLATATAPEVQPPDRGPRQALGP